MRNKKAKALRRVAVANAKQQETAYKYVLTNPHKPLKYTNRYIDMLTFDTEERRQEMFDATLAMAERRMCTRVLDDKCARALYRFLKREL